MDIVCIIIIAVVIFKLIKEWLEPTCGPYDVDAWQQDYMNGMSAKDCLKKMQRGGYPPKK